MKILKGLIKYIFLAFIILVALGVIMIGVLFVFPDLTIFGLRFLTYAPTNIQYSSVVSNATTNPITAIKIIGGAYNVLVKPGAIYSEGIKIGLQRYVMGITKRSTGEIITITEYNATTDTLNISIQEPTGIIIHQECNVIVYLPQSMYDDNINLDISTDKGDIVIGALKTNESNVNNEEVLFDSPLLKSSKGTIYLGKTKITGDPKFELGYGSMTSIATTLFNADSTTIETYDSIIDLSTISSTDESFSYGNFIIKNSTSAQVKLGKCQNINYEGKGGTLEIDECNNLNATCSNTKIYVNKIVDGANIDITSEGSFRATEINGYSDITTSKNNILIENVNAKLTLLTNQGDINVTNATKYINATTSSGDINIEYKTDAPFNDSVEGYRQVMATTNNGSINLKGVDFVDVKINNEGEGALQIVFHDLAQKESKIFAKNIDYKIVVPASFTGDITGSDMIVKIASTVTPAFSVGFGYDTAITENVYTYYCYSASASTSAKLTIDAGNGKVTVQNTLV